MKITDWIKNNGSTVLTCFGAGGLIATVVLAIKATPGATDKIQTARIDKGEAILDRDREGTVVRNDDGSYEVPKLTVIETIQVCWKDYVPTVAVGISSLACIFGANALNRRQQAALASAYTALASTFEGYRDKVEMMCGPGTNAAIDKAIEQEKRDISEDRPPWDEVQTFFLECSEQPAFFERTMEQILQAEYDVNRYFTLRGSITLNEFLTIFGLETIENGDDIGWDDYIGEIAFGYQWIDFEHQYIETSDGLTVCSINLPFEPHTLDEEELERQFSDQV